MAINLSKVNLKHLLIYPLALVIVYGCAAGPTVQDVEALKGRIARLEKSLDDSREKVDELDTRLALLREKLNTEESDSAALEPADLTPPKGLKVIELSDGSIRIESQPPDEVSAGGGDATPANPRPRSSKSPALQKKASPAVKVRALPRRADTARTAKKATARAALTGKSLTPKSLYRKGQDLYLAGRYAEARAVFSDLAQRYPGSSLADNAFFWSGQTYYSENDFAKAIENYNIVVKIYPKGNKAPDALLMMGIAYVRTGDNAKATAVFTRLIKEYPGSEAARKASKRLKSLL